MTGFAARTLYLVRHAEALPDESELTDGGRRQAELLGARLRGVPLSVIHHGPLARAARTAELVAERLPGVPTRSSEAAGDYVPYRPARTELPADCAGPLLAFLDRIPPDDDAHGRAMADVALDRFTGPPADGMASHELVVTHNFLIGWLVRAAQYAPEWRWLGINQCHAALTVIRYTSDRPPAVLVFNDMAHLPSELRWTGFPSKLPC